MHRKRGHAARTPSAGTGGQRGRGDTPTWAGEVPLRVGSESEGAPRLLSELGSEAERSGSFTLEALLHIKLVRKNVDVIRR